MRKNEKRILPGRELKNGEATKTLSNHFGVGKEVIKTLKNKGGLTFQGIEEILLKCQEFRDNLAEKLKKRWQNCHDSKILAILSLGRVACAFVRWHNFTTFDAFLSYLTLEKSREIIKSVVEEKGGAPLPDRVMEVAIQMFEEEILHGAPKEDAQADLAEVM